MGPRRDGGVGWFWLEAGLCLHGSKSYLFTFHFLFTRSFLLTSLAGSVARGRHSTVLGQRVAFGPRVGHRSSCWPGDLWFYTWVLVVAGCLLWSNGIVW